MVKDKSYVVYGCSEDDRAFACSFMQLACNFLLAAKNDARIGPAHISVYMALLYVFAEQKSDPVTTLSCDIKPMAKTFSPSTFHYAIRQLDEFGYIKYKPSNYKSRGNLVYFNF